MGLLRSDSFDRGAFSVNELASWGLYPPPGQQEVTEIFPGASLPHTQKSLLPRGLGRSYGDTCLNSNGVLLSTRPLDHFLDFDVTTGTLTCESGVSLDEIIRVFSPRGWFPAVTPGTKYVTVGGAIANDVHGKNHHQAGNFSRSIEAFELLRSSGERVICSRTQNSDLFRATVGGLGLTGFITWVRMKLKSIQSLWIQEEQEKFYGLQDFLDLSGRGKEEYTVAWIDMLSSKSKLRGIFIRGDHEAKAALQDFHAKKSLNIPVFFPEWVLNPLSLRIFNELYFHKNIHQLQRRRAHYNSFFYPLDAVYGWNKIYGRRGFLQYQFVLPNTSKGIEKLEEIIHRLQNSSMGTFLAVLKVFGEIPSEGLLSFPRAGITLALDFPNYGTRLYQLLLDCDRLVAEGNGRVYLAKDSRLEKEFFQQFYPQAQEFKKWIDPHFSSSQWRRLT